MDDEAREAKQGFSWWYLKDVPLRKRLARRTDQMAGFGLGAQLFASLCKVVVERLGKGQGEELIREAVEYFGRRRGARIAEKVRNLGKPLSFKNWLIHTDIGADNFSFTPVLDNRDLVVKVRECSFIRAARDWGLEDLAALYCRYADHAILEGYNPAIKLELQTRHDTGKDYCLFRYIMKESNKG
ncbi:MAG: L-2-amino-thiazoline-4-carboxylic acid hydrolase [Thermodesulfobacteriota bacterium]